MSVPFLSRRFAVVAILATLIAGLAVVPAAADAGPGSSRLRRAFIAITDVAPRPDHTDAAVKLSCEPRLADASDRIEGALHCEWRAEVDVRTWQLWNIQVRPEHGERMLVAELGPDASSYTDSNVSVPGKYVCAVLGLDGSGEIIARSRVQIVKLAHRDIKVEVIDLGCKAFRTDAATNDVVTDAVPNFAIGCHWSEVRNEAAVGYVVYKAVNGGERSVLARVGINVTEIRDDAVAAGHRYTYVVVAVDGAGEVVGRSRAETVGVPLPERDRPIDRPVDRPVDRVTDRVTDRVPETDVVTDAVTDHGADAVTDEVVKDTADTDQVRD